MKKKKCWRCKKIKDSSEFYTHKTKKDGLSSECRSCNKERLLDYYQKNKSILIDYRYRHMYGITKKEKDEMYKKQKGLCAICHNKMKLPHDCHVDHDHKTGKIRKLLCRDCNHFIGKAKDDIQILKSAIDYLVRCSY